MSIECVICFEILQSSQTVHHTPCGHVFHQTCLSTWFERSKTCPECRESVDEDKIGKIYLHYARSDSKHDLAFLRLLVISKENEIRTLSEQLLLEQRRQAAFKRLVEIEMAAHKVTKSQLLRSLRELKNLTSSQLTVDDSWNTFSNIFNRISKYETISDSPSESTSHAETSHDQEGLISRLEQEMFSLSEIDNLICNAVLANTERSEIRNPERVEPVRKKLKTNGTPLDIIDLTKEPVNPLVDLTDDDDVTS